MIFKREIYQNIYLHLKNTVFRYILQEKKNKVKRHDFRLFEISAFSLGNKIKLKGPHFEYLVYCILFRILKFQKLRKLNNCSQNVHLDKCSFYTSENV